MRAFYLILQTGNVSRRVIQIYKNEASIKWQDTEPRAESLILISYKSRSQMILNRGFLTVLSHLKSRDNIFSESLGWGKEKWDIPYLISFSLGPHFTYSRGTYTTHFPEGRLEEWMQAEWKGEGNERWKKEDEREVWVQQISIRSCFK